MADLPVVVGLPSTATGAGRGASSTMRLANRKRKGGVNHRRGIGTLRPSGWSYKCSTAHTGSALPSDVPEGDGSRAGSTGHRHPGPQPLASRRYPRPTSPPEQQIVQPVAMRARSAPAPHEQSAGWSSAVFEPSRRGQEVSQAAGGGPDLTCRADIRNRAVRRWGNRRSNRPCTRRSTDLPAPPWNHRARLRSRRRCADDDYCVVDEPPRD
jgi:hypothetical protein